jgi:tetratricopeptide (TPR) repeat protein
VTTRRVRAGGTLAAIVLVGWWGWAAYSAWSVEEALRAARQEIAEGRPDAARRRLATLPAAHLDEPDASYLLGVCEHEAGRFESALACWTRVPRESPLFHQAALARARTLVGDLGRYADAGSLLEAALLVAGPGRTEIRHALSQIYFEEGRRDAMRRLLRESWSRAPNPAAELRDLWMIDQAQTHYESVLATLEAAGRKAPDDDRVWLGRAHLAIQAGAYDEARRLLARCIERRPDDSPVWRARLDLARAEGDVATLEEALTHLPKWALTDSEVFSLRAWLAARRADARGEREALERLVALDPGSTQAWERLAVLAFEAGDEMTSQEYRRKKAEADRAKERYRRLVENDVPTGGFDELATLAETLGRDVEAVGWWTLAARSGNPSGLDRALARLRLERERPDVRVGPTLIDQVAPGRAVATTPPAAEPVLTPTFVDDASSAGLVFRYQNGRSPQRQLPETTSGGVGLLDLDGDGWLDVFCVQGGVFPPDAARPNDGDRLFRNRRDGTFEDVTVSSGIAAFPRGYGHGVAVGDYDNDGDPDLFVTRWRSYALYRNRGDGTFEDATNSAGLAGDRDWPTSAAFADLDGDGDLDLYVCHYLQWDAEHPRLCPRALDPGEAPDPERLYDYCMPHPFPALPDHLFRNDGGRFVDVTPDMGFRDRDGRGLGVVVVDVDDDGRPDLFVANDTTANYLLHNEGGMKFEEVGLSSGVASNADGAFQAGMGTAAGDLDGDGRPDLFVTNFYGESTTYYRNLGGGMFSDRTAAVGLAAPTRFRLGFGITPLDANNDRRLDLAVANGHVIDDRPKFPYAMPAQLLVTNAGRLSDVSASAGAAWSVSRVARGLAAGDLDNDGRVDLVMVDQAGPLVYFHNRTERPGHFLTLRLVGGPSNRDAVGAVVTVRVGAETRRGWRVGGGSYQSAADPRLHFGLGGASRVDEVKVRWPSGKVDHFKDLPADRGYELREGQAGVTPLAGFARPPATP